MDLSTVAVSAVVGAGVAIATYLATDKLKQADAQVQQALAQGYYNGRESILQHWQMPADARDLTER